MKYGGNTPNGTTICSSIHNQYNDIWAVGSMFLVLKYAFEEGGDYTLLKQKKVHKGVESNAKLQSVYLLG